MSEIVRILVIEDSEDDTLLLIRHLRKEGLNVHYSRVETKSELESSLKNNYWDLIIVDYVLPNLTGLQAIEFSKKIKPEIPIILISGNVSEDIAVNAMNAGANDCIMKDNLTRLLPVINREIRLRKSLKEKERKNHTQEKQSELMDGVDKQLVRLLQEEGRMKLVDLGNKILTDDKKGFSHVGVKNRIDKLMENDLIKIQANVNIQKLNFIMAFLLIETDSNESRVRIIKRYQECPRSLFIFETSGKYDLIFGFISENIKSLETFLNNYSPKVDKSVRDSVTYISSTIMIPKYYPIKYGFQLKDGNLPCGADCQQCDSHIDGNCNCCMCKEF